MNFQNVKGFRDFYPEQLAVRNYICEAWRRVAVRNGFVEYDGPILEYLDLYRVKSGEGIVGELFSLTDRGGRELAIRPETTPTLARMVNAKINSLPRPIKWFSISQVCRAENPQKGRGREFYQWNADVIGSDDPLADVECIFTLIDLLRELKLGPDDAKVHISSRSLLTAALTAFGVPPARHPELLVILDKREKVGHDAFREMCARAGLDSHQMGAIEGFQDSTNLAEAKDRVPHSEAVENEALNLGQVFQCLDQMGAAEFYKLDLHVVRGLAYYTGVVYEAFDAERSLRALAGGGRYDNLLEALGGPRVGAAGFGMGDIVLGILLAEKGRLPELKQRCDVFVVADLGGEQAALPIVAELRRAGLSAGFSYDLSKLRKQLKAANDAGAPIVVIVPQGFAEGGKVIVKDLATGEQREVARDELLRELMQRREP